ncbi:MAG: glycosyltransferase family 2 protein [Vicinamibacterales bacterium]
MHRTVSVIVATRNRQALLRTTLEGLVAQRWPRNRFEIVVADNGSTDTTAETVRQLARRPDAPAVHYLFVAAPGKSQAVNAALAHATGDLLAFTDDDVQPSRDWLAALDAASAESGADFVAGRIRPNWEVPPPSWMSPALHGVLAIPDNGDTRLPIDQAHPQVVPIGANMAVRASAMAAVGGLRADLGKLAGTLRTGEDHDLFLRLLDAGYRGVYEPEAVVRHWVPRARLTREYCRRWLFQNGRDVARLAATARPPVPHLLGVPRYLWRDAASRGWQAARAAAAGDPAGRFAGSVRLVWLCGYLREAWLGGHASDTAVRDTSATRQEPA